MGRLELVLDSAQLTDQSGFRSVFNTMDHIQKGKERFEKHKEYNLLLYLSFIECEKEFDYV